MDLAAIAVPLPSDEEMIAFLQEAQQAKVIAVDTETTGLKVASGTDYAMGVSISFKTRSGDFKAMYFPIRHPSQNAGPNVLPVLKVTIETSSRIVFHHAKFDLISLESLGIKYEGEFYDTMLMAHLINEIKPVSKKLDTLCRFYIGPGTHKEMNPLLKGWIDLFGWHTVSGQAMYAYATQDAHITLELARVLYPLMLREISNNTEMWEHKQKMVRVLIAMAKRGVKVDAERCRMMVERADKEMARLTEELGFKPTPTKIGNYFIDQLGMPVLKYTDKGKPSFTAAILNEYEEMVERLYPGNETVKRILAYRGWQKSRSSFYQSWLDHMDKDGRIRPNYVMHKDTDDGGTVTGRLSCREPNLQQIPRITNKDWNKDVKPCLIPTPGYKLVEADYSQLELRLSTAYADEKGLKRVFNEGRDIFDEMAARLELTRDATKTFVYSTQYGAGVNRIKTVFNTTERAAREMRENYFQQYPGFARLANEAAYKARAHGKVRLWSGRYRHFQDPEQEAHKAMNACIQGGAADIVERIMVKCYEEFDNEEECRMLLQIHDAIVFEVKEDKLQEYLPKIKSTMESVNEIVDFGVKFSVDAHYWGSKEKLI